MKTLEEIVGKVEELFDIVIDNEDKVSKVSSEYREYIGNDTIVTKFKYDVEFGSYNKKVSVRHKRDYVIILDGNKEKIFTLHKKYVDGDTKYKIHFEDDYTAVISVYRKYKENNVEKKLDDLYCIGIDRIYPYMEQNPSATLKDIVENVESICLHGLYSKNILKDKKDLYVCVEFSDPFMKQTQLKNNMVQYSNRFDTVTYNSYDDGYSIIEDMRSIFSYVKKSVRYLTDRVIKNVETKYTSSVTIKDLDGNTLEYRIRAIDTVFHNIIVYKKYIGNKRITLKNKNIRDKERTLIILDSYKDGKIYNRDKILLEEPIVELIKKITENEELIMSN